MLYPYCIWENRDKSRQVYSLYYTHQNKLLQDLVEDQSIPVHQIKESESKAACKSFQVHHHGYSNWKQMNKR